MWFCAGVFTKRTECGFALLIADEIRNVLEQHEFERIRGNRWFWFSVICEQSLDYFWQAQATRARHLLCNFFRHFAHQRENVALGISEVREPQIVVRHRSDQVRLHDEFDAARLEYFIDLLDVVNLVIDDRGGMIQVGTIGDSQHDTNAATVEERHVWRRLKQKRHAERVAIKSNRAIKVFDVD